MSDDPRPNTPYKLYDEWQRAKTAHEVLLITGSCAPPYLAGSIEHLNALETAEIEEAKAEEIRAWEAYWASLKRSRGSSLS